MPTPLYSKQSQKIHITPTILRKYICTSGETSRGDLSCSFRWGGSGSTTPWSASPDLPHEVHMALLQNQSWMNSLEFYWKSQIVLLIEMLWLKLTVKCFMQIRSIYIRIWSLTTSIFWMLANMYCSIAECGPSNTPLLNGINSNYGDNNSNNNNNCSNNGNINNSSTNNNKTTMTTYVRLQ